MKNRFLFRSSLWAAFCVIASGALANSAAAEDKKLDQPPKPIKQAAPEFPLEMQMAGIGGSVKLAYLVNEEGNVEEVIVLASNNPWFDRPAIESVFKWHFEPGRKEGKPVRTWIKQDVDFHVRGSERVGLWAVKKTSKHKSLPAEFQWHTAPVPVGSNFPVYPFESLRAKVKGKTKVRFIIGPEGRVLVAEVMEATVPELGRAAVAAMETWLFTPPKKRDGTASFAVVEMEHDYHPSGWGNVPLTDSAKRILRSLDRNPAAVVAPKELDAMPKPLSQRAPVFPTALRDKGLSGEAEIEFFIDEDGDAQLPRIVSATAPEFGYAAAQAVAAWRFTPPRVNGKPAVVRVQVPVSFALSAAQKEASQ